MKVKVSSLKHHPKNKEIYTLSSIEELMESISEVGLLQSLIIDQHHQIISGNRRFESIKRLGWEEVEVNSIEVKEEEEELLLIHYNKQRIKSFKELINEYLILDNHYRKGQGKRTDLTSVKSNRSSSRDMASKELGISSSQLRRLVYIHINQVVVGFLTSLYSICCNCKLLHFLLKKVCSPQEKILIQNENKFHLHESSF